MKLFRKTDLIVVLAVLAVAAGVWAFCRSPAPGAAEAEIYVGAEKVLTIPLAAGGERTFSPPERPGVVLQISVEGAIRFFASDCPDQICVHAGKLNAPGQSAACLPNKVIVKLIPRGTPEEQAPDVIAG